MEVKEVLGGGYLFKKGDNKKLTSGVKLAISAHFTETQSGRSLAA
jgi:hypothetical protein